MLPTRWSSPLMVFFSVIRLRPPSDTIHCKPTLVSFGEQNVETRSPIARLRRARARVSQHAGSVRANTEELAEPPHKAFGPDRAGRRHRRDGAAVERRHFPHAR